MNTEVFSDEEVARWQERAARVEILRDRWGIAHIYGETDADTVFGTLYAQAEDDFNRVETNYINAMGRLAEAEGEGEIYRDLRMRLFIRQPEMEALYETSPDWLRQLMDAFADGLNYYLHTHPEVEPRVIKRFEPWMALTFTEGSIGGDIERVNIGQIARFLRPRRHDRHDATNRWSTWSPGAPMASPSPRRIRPAGNALFLINPTHVVLLPLGVAYGQRGRPQRLWRGDLGTVLRLSGIQRKYRLDAHFKPGRRHRRVSRNHRRGR